MVLRPASAGLNPAFVLDLQLELIQMVSGRFLKCSSPVRTLPVVSYCDGQNWPVKRTRFFEPGVFRLLLQLEACPAGFKNDFVVDVGWL